MKASETKQSTKTQLRGGLSGKLKLKWGKLDSTYRRSIIYTVLLHAVVLIALTVGWTSKVEVKPIAAPSHINAVVIDAETLEKLTNKKQKIIDAQAAKEKKKLDEKKKKQQQAAKRKKEQKKKQALAKKKLAEKKKLVEKKKKDDARKKAILKKKKDDERKLKEKKKREEQKQQEALQRKKEIKAKQEKELQEVMLQAERDREKALALEQERREKQRIAQEQAMQAQIAADRVAEMNEVDRFIALIREKIIRRWHKPAGAKVGQRIELRLELFPTGELSRVSVVKSSGHTAFDNSALSAARSISQYPVPKDNRIFEKNFRRFVLGFSHQEN